jgi:hypothetical protein
MSRALLLLIGVVVGAAAGGGSAYLAMQPRIETLESELREAERETRDANRLARAEHDRNRVLEGELETLRRALAQPPPPANDGMGHAPTPPVPLEPEDWDMDRVRTEIQMRATLRGRMIGSPRVDRLVRGVRRQGDRGTELVMEILHSNVSINLKMAAALIGAGLGEERVIEPVLALYAAATELPHRRAFLRALALLPGDQGVPAMLAAWNDTSTDARIRRPALHGLAMRGHETAISVVRGGAPGSTRALRAQAIESLHEHARVKGYADPDLLPVFLSALTTADGDGQRLLALIAIEGFWSDAAVPALEAFAAEDAAAEAHRARAAKLAKRLAAGEERPESAGLPTDEDLAALGTGGRRQRPAVEER